METTMTLLELSGFSPDHIEAIRNIGIELMDSSRFEDAAIIFRGLIELIPDDVEARLMLATVRTRQGFHHQAEDVFAEVLQLSPGNAIALAYRGESRVKRGDARGTADLRAAVKSDPALRLDATNRAKQLLAAA